MCTMIVSLSEFQTNADRDLSILEGSKPPSPSVKNLVEKIGYPRS
jgi:hypothetical protein